MTRLFVFLFFVFCSCKTTTYYVVRHAEKEAGTTMTATTTKTSDVPLSAAGKKRAEALKESLLNKKIKHIFSTSTLRTTSTAKPLSEAIGVSIETYDKVDKDFVEKLKQLNPGNVLIVAHSNTVDDIVNGIAGKKELSDLKDEAYGDLFILRKKGNSYQFSQQHFGK